MPAHSKVVLIGASAGGPDALRRLLKRLPADYPAAVLIVMHIGSHYSILPKILEKDANMPVMHAEDQMPIVPGVILVAPPDQHLLLEDGMTRLSRGAKENFSRPAIDPLFRTAAMFYRENAIGVVLTGLLDDGTIGLQAIKAYGGVALVQDPDEADEPSMPRSALQHVAVDGCLTIDGIADRLIALAKTESEPAAPTPHWDAIEIQGRFDLRQKIDLMEFEQVAAPSSLGCPECQGTLWEVKDSHPMYFRCHTGHAYTAQSLSSVQDTMIEEAVWAAIRALHEKQILLYRLAKSSPPERKVAAGEHIETAQSLASHAEILRKMISKRNDA